MSLQQNDDDVRALLCYHTSRSSLFDNFIKLCVVVLVRFFLNCRVFVSTCPGVCVCCEIWGSKTATRVFNEFFFDQTQKIPALAFSFFFLSTNSPFLWLISKNTHKQPAMCCVQYYTTTNNNNNKTGKAKRRNLS